MEIYTLNYLFEREFAIDEFESAIWTERYTVAGDVKLVLPATRERVKQLANGTFLGLRGTKEVMLLHTQSIEDNMLTVTGSTLEKLFDDRVIRTMFVKGLERSHKLRASPGKLMGYIVQVLFISYAIPEEVILDHRPHTTMFMALEIGPLDPSGSPITIKFKPGPLYPQLLSIAEAHDVGMTLRPKQTGSDKLVFSTYKGVDHTSDSTINELVRFSPDLDSFANVKELRSLAGYKNMIIAWLPERFRTGEYADSTEFKHPVIAVAPGEPFTAYNVGLTTGLQESYYDGAVRTHLGPGSTVIQTFDLRVMEMVFDDITKETADGPDPPDVTYGPFQGPTDTIYQILEQRAKAELTKNNKTRVIDGEVVPQPGYEFGKDYTLGDLVEVENYEGKIQKVRVTEYIRSQDETGKRGYPTLSQLDPPTT